MTKRKTARRISAVILCLVLVMGLSCPAFAATDPPVISGSIYVGSMLLHEDNFVVDGYKYVAYPFSPISLAPTSADVCIVTYGNIVRRLNWWQYNGELFDPAFCIGNPALLDPALTDNGEHFVFALSTTAPKSSYFACNAVFYSQHVQGAGENGLYVYFNAPAEGVDAPGILDEAAKVFGSGMRMVGDVAGIITSNPILYLPIVIGLCGLGIVLFRRLKQ